MRSPSKGVFRSAAFLAIIISLTACKSEPEVTGSTHKCATDMYPNYNSKRMDQCVDVCHQMRAGNANDVLDILLFEGSK